MGKLTQKTCREAPQSHKIGWVIIILIGFMFFLCVNLVSADLSFDNTIDFYKEVGDYGKYEIKDWFGLLKLQDLELKTNTEICEDNKCNADILINHYQKGTLVEDIRFLDIKTGNKTKIENYQLKVNGENYKIGNEIPKGDYNLEITGDLFGFQKVDWQIKSHGKWLDSWAVWTSGLNVNLVAYYSFDVNTTDNAVSGSTRFDLLANEGVTILGVGGCMIGDCLNLSVGKNMRFANTTTDAQNLIDIFSENKTWNLWAYKTTDDTGNVFIGTTNDEASFQWSDSLNRFGWQNLKSGGGDDYSTPQPTGRWVMITTTTNDTHYVVYINGTKTSQQALWAGKSTVEVYLGTNFNDVGDMVMRVDEFGLWNRTLSQTEVTQLYNSGSGIAYNPTPLAIEITLNTPLNNSYQISDPLSFNSSLVSIGGGRNLTNATVYLWYNNGTLFNTTIGIVTGTSNISIINITGIRAGKYIWNTRGCIQNTTTSTCNFALNNYTLNYGIIINSQTYTSSTVEGATNDFIINISYTSSNWDVISGTLNYNNTEYPGTKTGTGDKIIFTSSVAAPNINSQKNISFYWAMGLTDSIGTIYFNSTTYNQTVNIINMSLCGSPYIVPFVNFTIYDEQTFDELNGTIDLTFDYRQEDSTISNTFSYMNNFGNKSRFNFCISPSDQTYVIDSTLTYESTGYAQRYYNFEGVTFTNTTTEIGLYLLPTTNSTSFLVVVQDENYQPLADVEVYMQVYNAGTWVTTEISTTNDDGETINHIYTEDSIYRFKIYDDGTLLHTTTGSVISCPSTPCTVTITISEDIDSVLPDFEDLDSLTSSLVYDKVTKITTYTYTDTSGNFTSGRFYVIRKAFGEPNVNFSCNDTSSIATAVMTCDLSAEQNGTYIATGFITRLNERMIERKAFHKIIDIVGAIGTEGILWSMFLLIGILMLGVYRPSLGIIFGIVGVIFMSLLQLIQITITAIVAIIGIGIILLIGVGKQ